MCWQYRKHEIGCEDGVSSEDGVKLMQLLSMWLDVNSTVIRCFPKFIV